MWSWLTFDLRPADSPHRGRSSTPRCRALPLKHTLPLGFSQPELGAAGAGRREVIVFKCVGVSFVLGGACLSIRVKAIGVVWKVQGIHSLTSNSISCLPLLFSI